MSGNGRQNQCDGKRCRLTSSLTPILSPKFSGEYGTLLVWSFLLRHIAIPRNITPRTFYGLLHYIRNSGLHLHQQKDAVDPSDPCYSRVGNNLHSDSPNHRGQSIGYNTPSNKKFHQSLINAFKQYGLRVLNVPKGNIDLTKIDIRAYLPYGLLGPPNDYTGLVDDVHLILRVCAGIGSRKRVTLTLMQRHPNSTKDPVMFRDWREKTVSGIELDLPSVINVYAMTPFASGKFSFGVIGDNHIMAYHAVENMEDGIHATFVADYHFDSVEGLMAAVDNMKTQPFDLHFDFDISTPAMGSNNIMLSHVSIISLL